MLNFRKKLFKRLSESLSKNSITEVTRFQQESIDFKCKDGRSRVLPKVITDERNNSEGSEAFNLDDKLLIRRFF